MDSMARVVHSFRPCVSLGREFPNLLLTDLLFSVTGTDFRVIKSELPLDSKIHASCGAIFRAGKNVRAL